jgi:hypothetical protein
VNVRRIVWSQVDGAGSQFYPGVDVGISGVEPSGFATRVS